MFNFPHDKSTLYFQHLRDHYEKIIYFEDSPDPRKIFTNIIDYVDIYYKKSILKDRSLYKNEFYSQTVFGDYYHNKYKIDDDKVSISAPLTDQQIEKIKLAWNIGIGSYPRTRVRRKICMYLKKTGLIYFMGIFFNHPKNYKTNYKKTNFQCPMRLRSTIESASIDYQRVLFNKIAKTRADLFTFGILPLNLYNKELKRTKITISPFGLGEVCFRDFEAVINFSLLLKPDMEHLITWPNIYIKDKTYVPLQWDGSDFITKVEYWLDNDPAEILKNAYDTYISSFNQYRERLDSILNEIHNI
jgi:hypothetical protein